MSVDGALLTDVIRHADQWRVGDQRGMLVMTVTGAAGTGRSAVLRNIALMSHRQVTIAPLNDEQGVGLLFQNITASSSSRPLTTISFAGATRPLPFQRRQWWCWSLMMSSCCINCFQVMMRGACPRCSLRFTRLAASTTADEEGRLPTSVIQHARAVIRYAVPRTLSTAACYRHLCGAGFSRDVSASISDAMIDVPLQVLSTAAAAAHGQTLGNECTVPQCVEAISKFMDSGDQELTLLRRIASHEATEELFGTKELLARLEMLCRIHIARHSAEGSAQALSGFRPGRVATSSTATTGVFLHGPSGCGKTSLLRHVASRLPSMPIFVVQGSSLYAKYLGESEERLRFVFSQARSKAPCVLVIEDIDVLAVSRKSADSGGGRTGVDVTKRMLAALLCEMDGVEDNSGVLVIGTSNQPDHIDHALLRQGRLETLLMVPPLDASSVREMTYTFLAASGDEGTARSCSDSAALSCAGCSAVGLRFLFQHLVETMEGLSDDQPLTLPLWLQCTLACRAQIAPPVYSWSR
ncbi:Hypothetical protein, putative [Bodo saltans]|uniref:AAA+ ATPase domain-containing protein n=1 Tax=Bodo saltans TaxID=75058 RepID=A0A0S4J3P5_BODSA|nr:Hypothetical protein, putative [Bodo saltans]|eukprot:CUG69190.1 Hypothetical protein, putative [Bodo saltans]